MLNSFFQNISKKLPFMAAFFCVLTSPLRADHGVSVFGDLKYPKDFSHFDYVNPDAPKGGEVDLASFMGTFDSLNPYLVKGTPAVGVGMLHCSLMQPSADEPASSYAYLAESIEVSLDKAWVTFRLNPTARFTDGTPVTAEDVVFSFDVIKEKGSPNIAMYFRDVDRGHVVDKHTVKFHLTHPDNRELPQALSALPVFSKAHYTKHDFAKADLTVPLGCGPYVVKDIQPGRSISYGLKKDWWGKDLPSQKGSHNFDVTYNYYRDQTVLFEAFKSGEVDFREENIAKNWAHGYDFPAAKEGKVIRQETPKTLPATLQFFVFNMRNPLFQDVRVREALQYAFDFEWMNENMFHGAYARSESYFANSPMAATGLPQGEELDILLPFKDQLPEKLFTQEFHLPKSKGDGRNRAMIREADKLLRESGWMIKDGKRVNAKTGKTFEFTMLSYDPAYDKVMLALQRGMKTLGITMHIRMMTPAQYVERIENFDYDMVSVALGTSDTPGNEQRDLWASTKADVKGTHNLAGVKNPVVDQLLELIVTAETREQLNARVRALDRVLLWNYYGILNWHSPTSRIAYWDKFGMPKTKPRDGIGFETWWVDPQKEKMLGQR